MTGVPLTVEDLWVDRAATRVLRGVSLVFRPGAMVAILGPNGAGKSTLLMALAGLVAPRRGRVLLGTQRIDTLPAERVARQGVVLVPQGRHLFSELTVRENLALARFAQRPATPLADPAEWLDRLGDMADRLDVPVGLLSGGQQQVVALIRGLLPHPRVLLCDEPTAALSQRNRSRVLTALRELADGGTAVVVVEQEVDAVLEIADEAVVMQAGMITSHSTEPRSQLLPFLAHTAFTGG